MLTLPMVFGDHMILQREKPVKIFGTGEPGKKVTAALCDAEGKKEAESSSFVSEEGSFLLELPPLAAGTEKTLTVTDGEDRVVINDVAVGEVWLAGGQSNMEYLMHTDAERDREKEGLKTLPEEVRARIRFFDYPEISYEGMEKTVDLSHFGFWRCLTEEDLPYFSAVSYFFERKIADELDCPIGVIGCNWGGTRACCWMPEEVVKEAGGEVWIRDYEEGLKKIPDMEKAVKAYKNGNQNVVPDPADSPNPVSALFYPGYSYKQQQKFSELMGAADEAFMTAIIPLHPIRPSGLYYTMLKKVMPYTLRGFIYYQGCSDDVHSDLYAAMMDALIKCWRRDWGEEDLPFFMVQLAPFEQWLTSTGKEYPVLRDAQLKAADGLDNVWVASIGDAGMRYDIHPKHKRKPGERLGLLALAHVYGKDVAADAPRAKELTYDGDTAVIRFENGSGLHLRAPENAGFTDEEAKAVGFEDPDVPPSLPPEENLKALLSVEPSGDVTAALCDDMLRVNVFRDGQPVKPAVIRFAETPYYEINVYNEAGLPAYPFTIKG